MNISSHSFANMRIDITKIPAFLLSPDNPKYEPGRIHSMNECNKIGVFPTWFKAVPHE